MGNNGELLVVRIPNLCPWVDKYSYLSHQSNFLIHVLRSVILEMGIGEGLEATVVGVSYDHRLTVSDRDLELAARDAFTMITTEDRKRINYALEPILSDANVLGENGGDLVSIRILDPYTVGIFIDNLDVLSILSQ